MPATLSVCAGTRCDSPWRGTGGARWRRAVHRAAGIRNAGGGEWDILGTRVYQFLSVPSTRTHTGRAEPQGRNQPWLLNRAQELHVHAWWRSVCCPACVPTGYSVGVQGRREKVDLGLWAACGQGSGLGRDG